MKSPEIHTIKGTRILLVEDNELNAEIAKTVLEDDGALVTRGQVGMPHPVEGMRRCIRALLENGLSQQQVNYMVRDNPATLVGLSAI